jgi:hypothetical protein
METVSFNGRSIISLGGTRDKRQADDVVYSVRDLLPHLCIDILTTSGCMWGWSEATLTVRSWADNVQTDTNNHHGPPDP